MAKVQGSNVNKGLDTSQNKAVNLVGKRVTSANNVGYGRRVSSGPVSPNENDQGRKGTCFFQRLIALKCLKCQKIEKNI
jgi:hypothetical protein